MTTIFENTRLHFMMDWRRGAVFGVEFGDGLKPPWLGTAFPVWQPSKRTQARPLTTKSNAPRKDTGYWAYLECTLKRLKTISLFVLT